jgi:hypothetical protein
MARVIVPDVTAYVQSATRTNNRRYDPNASGPAPKNVGEQIGIALGYAEKIANNPLVVGGVDAIRRNYQEGQKNALAFDIRDATATANEDIKNAAVRARMKASQPAPAQSIAPAQAAPAAPVQAAPAAPVQAAPVQAAPAPVSAVQPAPQAQSPLLPGQGPHTPSRDFRAIDALSPEARQKAIQIMLDAKNAGADMTQRDIDNLAGELGRPGLTAGQIADRERMAANARREAAEAPEREKARRLLESQQYAVKRGNDGIRVGKIAALSQALADADTMEEIEAIRQQMARLRQVAPASQAAPAAVLHDSSEADRINELRFNTRQFAPGPAQAATPQAPPTIGPSAPASTDADGSLPDLTAVTSGDLFRLDKELERRREAGTPDPDYEAAVKSEWIRRRSTQYMEREVRPSNMAPLVAAIGQAPAAPPPVAPTVAPPAAQQAPPTIGQPATGQPPKVYDWQVYNAPSDGAYEVARGQMQANGTDPGITTAQAATATGDTDLASATAEDLADFVRIDAAARAAGRPNVASETAVAAEQARRAGDTQAVGSAGYAVGRRGREQVVPGSAPTPAPAGAADPDVDIDPDEVEEEARAILDTTEAEADKMQAAMGDVQQVMELHTPQAILLAAANARTPQERRIVAMAAEHVDLPATNIFEALGFVPPKGRGEFAEKVIKAFPKAPDQGKLEMERLKLKNEKELQAGRLTYLTKKAGYDAAESAARIAAVAAGQKSPEERAAKAAMDNADAAYKNAQALGYPDVVQARLKSAAASATAAWASILQARAHQQDVDARDPREKKKIKVKAAKEEVSAAGKAVDALTRKKAVLDKVVRDNQPLPDIAPPPEYDGPQETRRERKDRQDREKVQRADAARRRAENEKRATALAAVKSDAAQVTKDKAAAEKALAEKLAAKKAAEAADSDDTPPADPLGIR